MTGDASRRRPEAFRLDDPDLVERPDALGPGDAAAPGRDGRNGSAGPRDQGQGGPAHPEAGRARITSAAARRRGFRWGALLLAALSALAGLALALSFAQFVAAAFERQDWIGWLAFGLIVVAGLAFVVIVARELVGMLRLGQLGRLKGQLEASLARSDQSGEQRALEAIFGRLADRPELKWPLAELAEHTRGVNDPGDLARLADRDVMPALDGDARRLVAASARRVSVVTALSPMAAITVGWVLMENLRLLRSLAALYGGQPGFLGSLRLARMVLTHIVATGGVALTEDLLGQFLGQDLLRRLSRRLGESVFNAALTARVGAAAIEVIRPLPYLAAPRIRARDLIGEAVRMARRGSGEGREGAREGPDAT